MGLSIALNLVLWGGKKKGGVDQNICLNYLTNMTSIQEHIIDSSSMRTFVLPKHVQAEMDFKYDSARIAFQRSV